MSESKGTPGEWRVHLQDDGYIAVVTDYGDATLAESVIGDEDDELAPAEIVANFTLMAQSKRLLAACKEVRDVLRKLPLGDSLDPPDWAIVTLGAAIAAATIRSFRIVRR